MIYINIWTCSWEQSKKWTKEEEIFHQRSCWLGVNDACELYCVSNISDPSQEEWGSVKTCKPVFFFFFFAVIFQCFCWHRYLDLNLSVTFRKDAKTQGKLMSIGILEVPHDF